MNEKLPCWNCGVALPDVPPQGIYCAQCGNYNGPLNPTVPIVPIENITWPVLPIPDGSVIDVEAVPDPPEATAFVISWNAIEHGCRVYGGGLVAPSMQGTVTANGVALRIHDGAQEGKVIEVRLCNDFLIALFPLLFQTMNAEQLQEVAELFAEFE